MDFAHLHVHTEFSLLDGFARIHELVRDVKNKGMTSVAITDHGSMYGVVDFYRAAKEVGIKPIIGCEVYVAPRSRHLRDAGIDDQTTHLVLLAKNETGYRNLIRLVSLGFTEGFYYRPRVDWELLETHSEGIVALSACLGGDIPQAILAGDEARAKSIAQRLAGIYPGDFYLELQEHGIPEQKGVNLALLRMSEELRLPLVVTNDCHYVTPQEHKAHDVLLCIQTGKVQSDANRMRFVEGFHVTEPREFLQRMPYVPLETLKQAMANTIAIAERCDVEFTFGALHLPHFEIPDGFTESSYLRHLCFERLNWRYADPGPEVLERLEYELDVLDRAGYAGYFLIVQDFTTFARQRDIPVGPGRGSAVGSLVAYILGITDLDPLPYDLLFERFLHMERVSMPDIDIDFCYERREEVISYVTEKYGHDNVCQIITFGTLGARAVVRDVARVLGLPLNEADRLAKLVPEELNITLNDALEKSQELAALYSTDARVRELLDIARSLEGMPRHSSVHAAGVVITPEPLTNLIPLARSGQAVITQFNMNTVMDLGLLKMDFLGLRTLTVIHDCIKLVQETRGKKLDFTEIGYADPETYAMLSRGEALGVFQLEGGGMRNFFAKLRPSSFEDIIAGISLFRPGPMEQIPRYLQNREEPASITYADPRLEPILKVTYGCIVYQEQVQQVVRELAGYSLGRADMVRRAMAKKKPEIMELERKYFLHGVRNEQTGEVEVPGALAKGVPEAVANKVFDEMAEFAKYAFNKSHGAGYAVLAYQTAYLKCHYPAEYMAALMSSVAGNTDKLKLYLEECKRLGIAVLPPDINESMAAFTVSGADIRFGMMAIKNVGAKVIEPIVQRRATGPYLSLFDFLSRLDDVSLNRRVLEYLIKAGALASLGLNRRQLLAMLDECLEKCQIARRTRESGQLSIFEMMGDCVESVVDVAAPDVPDFAVAEILEMEKDLLGFYVSGHPLDPYRIAMRRASSHLSQDLGECEDKAEVVLAGMISECRPVITRGGKSMAFLQVEDFAGSFEAVVFPREYDKCADKLSPGRVVSVRGQVNHRDQRTSLAVSEMKLLTPQAGEVWQDVTPERVILTLTSAERELMLRVRSLLQRNGGEVPVFLRFPEQPDLIKVNEEMNVCGSEQLLDDLRGCLGRECVEVTYSKAH